MREHLESVRRLAALRRGMMHETREVSRALATGVVAARDAGHTVAEIASAADVSRQAIYDFMRRHHD